MVLTLVSIKIILNHCVRLWCNYFFQIYYFATIIRVKMEARVRNAEKVINADVHQGLRDKLAKVRTSLPFIAL